MKTIRNLLILLTLILNSFNSFSQNFDLNDVHVNVSKTRMLVLDIPKSNEPGIIKRTVEFNKLVVYDNKIHRENFYKLSLKKKSNKSRQSITPGKYEVIVTNYVNGIIKKEVETFQVL